MKLTQSSAQTLLKKAKEAMKNTGINPDLDMDEPEADLADFNGNGDNCEDMNTDSDIHLQMTVSLTFMWQMPLEKHLHLLCRSVMSKLNHLIFIYYYHQSQKSPQACTFLTAVCIIQGMRLFILKKNKCLVNSISPSILHRMI